MKKLRLGFAVFYLVALLLSMTAFQAAAQDANFVGTWDMTVTGGGRGGQGSGQADGQSGGQSDGQAGGGHHGGRGGPQSLTIAKDGDKFKVTHKTQRGDNTADATVSGNTISWSEQRQGRDGNTMKIEFKATLDGDTLKGTMGGGQYTREFTAARHAS
ncbi:MAG: hypothetical protein WCF88_13890 [Candidatus Acidiferrales bacterium]|jgi:hypothetical protein